MRYLKDIPLYCVFQLWHPDYLMPVLVAVDFYDTDHQSFGPNWHLLHEVLFISTDSQECLRTAEYFRSLYTSDMYRFDSSFPDPSPVTYQPEPIQGLTVCQRSFRLC